MILFLFFYNRFSQNFDTNQIIQLYLLAKVRVQNEGYLSFIVSWKVLDKPAPYFQYFLMNKAAMNST